MDLASREGLRVLLTVNLLTVELSAERRPKKCLAGSGQATAKFAFQVFLGSLLAHHGMEVGALPTIVGLQRYTTLKGGGSFQPSWLIATGSLDLHKCVALNTSWGHKSHSLILHNVASLIGLSQISCQLELDDAESNASV